MIEVSAKSIHIHVTLPRGANSKQIVTMMEWTELESDPSIAQGLIPESGPIFFMTHQPKPLFTPETVTHQARATSPRWGKWRERKTERQQRWLPPNEEATQIL